MVEVTKNAFFIPPSGAPADLETGALSRDFMELCQPSVEETGSTENATPVLPAGHGGGPSSGAEGQGRGIVSGL